VTTPTTTTQQDDQDVQKGAVEGDKPTDNQPRSGLDKNGLPVDKTAICEDAIGANVDKSQG
jgi:hypothetical protein